MFSRACVVVQLHLKRYVFYIFLINLLIFNYLCNF